MCAGGLDVRPGGQRALTGVISWHKQNYVNFMKALNRKMNSPPACKSVTPRRPSQLVHVASNEI